MMEREAFTFFKSFYEGAQALDDEDRLAFYDAIAKYALTGELPELNGAAKACFIFAKPVLDSNRAKAEAGKRGGQAKQTSSTTEASDKQTGSKSEAEGKQTVSNPEAIKNKENIIKNKENIIKNKGLGIKNKGEKKEEVLSDTSVSDCRTDVQRVVEAWNGLATFGIHPVYKVTAKSKRYQSLVARIRDYGIENVLKAVDNLSRSRFAQGHNSKGWLITFDWFVRPENFPKVLEGNYNDRRPDDRRSPTGISDFLELAARLEEAENEQSRDGPTFGGNQSSLPDVSSAG